MGIEVFGAGAIQSAYISYLAINISPTGAVPPGTGSTILVWPNSYIDVPYTSPTGQYYQAVAAAMDITTAALNINTITLPDATKASVGQNFIITNVGLSAFNVLANDGITILKNITPMLLANSFWFLLTDNTTSNGTWEIIQFGAGTSQADATALSGYGLTPLALAGKLSTNVPIITTAAVPVIAATSRATLYIWTGIVVTDIPLPLIASVLPGFHFSFSNQGTAAVTISVNIGEPALTKIDNGTFITIPQGTSLTIISDGTNWWTLGFSDAENNVITMFELDISPSINHTLSSTEAQANIQKYFGTLTADITIFFPQIPGYWFIQNDDISAFNLSVQIVGGVGTSYIVPKGRKQLFYLDNRGVAPSLHPSPDYFETLYLGNGSAVTPALAFSATPATGFFNVPAAPRIGVTIAGALIASFATGAGNLSAITIFSGAGGPSIQLNANNTISSMFYNTNQIFSINLTGTLNFNNPPTFASGPLLITSGGTGAITQPLAAKNILPTAVAGDLLYYNGTNWVVVTPTGPGSIVYYNGTNWIDLPIGAINQRLTVGAGNTLIWAP